MTIITCEFWQHRRSGDVHAILIDNSPAAPVVIAASDSLYIPDLLTFRRSPDSYDLLPVNADWFNRHCDDYDLYIPVFGN